MPRASKMGAEGKSSARGIFAPSEEQSMKGGLVKPLAVAASVTLLWVVMNIPAPGQVKEPRKLLTTADIMRLPVPPPDVKIPYGPDPFEFAELRLPKSPGPHPVVIVIHGGCWLAEYDLHHISSFAAALARNGIATWSLEYRRVGNSGGGWPGTFEDVAHGADYLRTIAPRYHLDLGRVVAVGHSAGGHLALWLAARQRLPKQCLLHSSNPVPLRGVVTLAGVPDLSEGIEQRVCGDSIERLMGGTPQALRERYRQGSPSELLPLGVPQRLIHGARDSIVPLKPDEDYAKAAQKRGDDAQVIILPDDGHFELIVTGTSAWDAVEKNIQELLK